MDGFFSEQPCYRIEILEWINEEDITDEWRYIWKHDPPEPVYDCPDDDANYEKDENAGTGVAAKRLSKFTLFPRLWR